jgi:hypothetical protein
MASESDRCGIENELQCVHGRGSLEGGGGVSKEGLGYSLRYASAAVSCRTQPLQRMNACAIRWEVGSCRDARGLRPRLLAIVVRLSATVAVHR